MLSKGFAKPLSNGIISIRQSLGSCWAVDKGSSGSLESLSGHWAVLGQTFIHQTVMLDNFSLRYIKKLSRKYFLKLLRL